MSSEDISDSDLSDGAFEQRIIAENASLPTRRSRRTRSTAKPKPKKTMPKKKVLSQEQIDKRKHSADQRTLKAAFEMVNKLLMKSKNVKAARAGGVVLPPPRYGRRVTAPVSVIHKVGGGEVHLPLRYLRSSQNHTWHSSILQTLSPF
eukprot:gnl/Dysnectes_brevis/3305_a4150_1544.p1 GENE.gnl/Dysnectes_brevis/3305_a4150_1544~~gnl/Dysnectes_brevis/3305_a4150_1544.p1  ORF type:complete len:148 (-),score=5.61 gnl/Dysnectes_brevis/3305_a4150_1544:147-590(-)